MNAPDIYYQLTFFYTLANAFEWTARTIWSDAEHRPSSVLSAVQTYAKQHLPPGTLFSNVVLFGSDQYILEAAHFVTDGPAPYRHQLDMSAYPTRVHPE